jgi:hypothetical protein
MMRLSEAGAALGVPHLGADVEFPSVGSDSRAVTPGMLFVALKGERFDGHDFVAEVLAKGAAGAMVERSWAAANPGLPLVAVNDTRLALGQLAAAWRARFPIPLLGITGSNGKTTVKEMCAAILRAHFGGNADAVLATRGNLNNDIGLPLTLLGLRDTHRAAVIEMGMSHSGEIDYLTRLAAPTVALVNNAQRAHLEGMGTVQDVALAKGEIFAGLSASGVAVFNADDPQAGIWRELSRDCRQVGFGLDRPADVHGRFVARGAGRGAAAGNPLGSARTRPRRARRPQCAQCLRRRRGDAGRGRLAGGGEAGAGSLRGDQGAPAAPRGTQWCAGDRRHLQTPIRIPCARRSTCWPRYPASASWSWATWARRAPRPGSSTTRSVAMPRAAASTGCFASATCRSRRHTTSAPAASTSPASRTCSKRCAASSTNMRRYWSRDRDS